MMKNDGKNSLGGLDMPLTVSGPYRSESPFWYIAAGIAIGSLVILLL